MCPRMIDIQNVRIRLSCAQHRPRDRHTYSDSATQNISLLAFDITLLWKRNHKVSVGYYRLHCRQMPDN
jgi:hypothetical protein